MANFMHASFFLPELQYFKWLKLLFLNCVWKLGSLKSSQKFKWFCALCSKFANLKHKA